jgi:maltose alpha-D-glucosyltransferase/alpha-amylase
VIYELRVRSFYDSNGDGIGDFPGLLEKLGYLQDLGVSALWLLPFYPSPLRDDGYDIADYTGVHPSLGTLDDFRRFLDEAHRRGLFVITELVLNHTSDQHAWFQRARRALPGSPERDFYVWSDTPDRYREARIVFSDFEPSNWAWDPIARAYFWHRFYSHQPDLNFDNPLVKQAMMKVVDFWLGMGVDGLRLDAIPYLFEREGTSCENLPETHELLRELRAHVDARYPDRMLLAEANQWPEDAVAFFGKGDECHMAFHFPIMPRIFMAIHQEDRFPLVDTLAQTPSIPDGCQWALFLRNHDELTLETVTDEERDVMYRAYATEPEMRVNLGIRRRLAPLAGNDRRVIELMNALLFALPGTPVVYYGDEIGMGDNVYLGDRDGVRTPMQWSADKNAGFSRANPQRLAAPVIIDPMYHYEAVNVETEQASPASLLWWTKHTIALRRRHHAFGRGSIEVLHPENRAVLAFVRALDDERILAVHNLSRFAQFVELDLSAYAGLVPTELFGRGELPPIGTSPYPLTLGGHGFYWLSLERPRGAAALAAAWDPPVIPASEPLGRRVAAGRDAGLGAVLAGWCAAQPWFLGGDKRVEEARIVDVVPVDDAALVMLETTYQDRERDRWVLPLAFASGAEAGAVLGRARHAVLAIARDAGGEEEIVYDVIAEGARAGAFLDAVLSREKIAGRAGEVTAAHRAIPGAADEHAADTAGITVLGRRALVDVARRFEEGPSPGLEIARFLAERPRAANVPELVASVEYAAPRAPKGALFVIRSFVASDGDALAYATAELGRYYDRTLARGPEQPAPEPPGRDLLRLAQDEAAIPAAARDAVGSYADAARLLGRRTAELHLALASDPSDPAFAPEPYAPHDRRGAYQTARSLAGRCVRLVRARARFLPDPARAAAARVLARTDVLGARLGALLERPIGATRARRIGGPTLASVLHAGNDFVFADLDGDRALPLSLRRRKGSPLRDVASLVRSYHEAAWTVLLDPTRVRAPDREAARPWAEVWWQTVSASLLRGYLEAAGSAVFVPRAREERALLVDVLLLESALAGALRALEAASADPDGRRAAAALELCASLLE